MFGNLEHQHRVYGLDILRAWAIIFVVYAHGNFLLVKHLPMTKVNLLVPDGVSIFFVLSGFLIGGVLIKSFETQGGRGRALLTFWKRRWLRTLPNYFLVLIILLLLSSTVEFFQATQYFLFLQNLNTAHPVFFPEAWSLAVEEWFYLLIPFGLVCLLRMGLSPKSSVLSLIVWVILFSSSVRLYRYYSLDIGDLYALDLSLRKQVITRLDSIMFGVLGAYLNHYHPTLWLRHRKQLLWLGVGMLILHRLLFGVRDAFNWELNLYYCVFSFSVASLGTLCLLPLLSQYKTSQGWIYKALTVVSICSYSMYLIHLSLVQGYIVPLFSRFAPEVFGGLGLALLQYGVYWGCTLLGSMLMYQYFEAPMTRLRDKSFFSWRSQGDEEKRPEECSGAITGETHRRAVP